MPSMKSAFDLGLPPDKRKLPRRRLLKRGGSHRPFRGEDIPYLYAAYRRKALNGTPEGMNPAEFRVYVEAKVAEQMETGGDYLTLICQTPLGEIPVGVVQIIVTQAPDVRPQAIPHVIWFPEASVRNKLEASVRFLDHLRKGFMVLIVAGEANWRFFHRVGQYGVIRAVGKLRNYYADGSDAMFYQGS